MKSIYKKSANKSGVYKIKNLINERIYIGSAKCFKVRLNQHLQSLHKGIHHNKFLQNDFNKCGEEAFEFHVIEVIEGEQSKRLLAEQKYLNQFHDNQKLCYNFKPRAKQKSRSCYSNTPEETFKKKSKAAKKRWQDPNYRAWQSQVQSIKTKEQWNNPEQRAAKIKGLKRVMKTADLAWSSERKEKASKRMQKASHAFKPTVLHCFRNPSEKIVCIKNLSEYCRKHPELNRSGMSMLHLGTLKTYKGWTKAI